LDVQDKLNNAHYGKAVTPADILVKRQALEHKREATHPASAKPRR